MERKKCTNLNKKIREKLSFTITKKMTTKHLNANIIMSGLKAKKFYGSFKL